jgi:MFS family permease
MLLFGQALALFNGKYVLISAIVFFMLGSAVSGAAYNIETLIIGRAIAGIGAAGCWVSVQTTVATLVDLESRPLILGLFGIQNAVSGTCGPILAGALTNRGQWRWCFLLVLPLGVISIILNLFVIPSLPPWPIAKEIESKLDQKLESWTKVSWKGKSIWLKRALLVDITGYLLITSALVCFILAVQWGGDAHTWGSSVVIGLFVGFFAILAAWLLWECKTPWPLVMPRIFLDRTVAGATIMAMLNLMCNLFAATYLPVLYEAGRGVSSLKAGVLVIPFLMSVVVAQALQGFIMTWTKHFWTWGLVAPTFLAIGGGLLFTVGGDTKSSTIIGYQIIYGTGVGLVQNVPYIAVQADSTPEAVSSKIATVSFGQLFGGLCGPVIGGAILDSELTTRLATSGVSSIVASTVKSSVDAIWELKRGQLRDKVIAAYISSLDRIFVVSVPVSLLIIVAGACIRNVRLSQGAH